MKTFKTTVGTYIPKKSRIICIDPNWYEDEEIVEQEEFIPHPIPPDSGQWDMCSSSTIGNTIFWFWVKE